MIKAVIIDDEERARNTLFSFITDFCEGIEIVASSSNVPDGVLAINKHKPDLVFLDIEMPEYSGFDLINFFREIDFEIIFVTAYSEYAIKAFDVSAIDYLLKPLDIDQLKNAIEKVKTKKLKTNMPQRLELLKESYKNEEFRRIALPMNDGLLFIEVADIILIEAEGAYSNLFLKNGSKILVSKRLKFFEELLQNRNFIYRPHRSFLVNLNYIKKYIKGDGAIIMDNTFTVAISRDKKSEFETLLKELKLSM